MKPFINRTHLCKEAAINRKILLPQMIGLAFVLLFLASCSTPTFDEFPTGKFVHEQINSRAFQFNEDGTWGFFAGKVELPTLKGTYSVDGNLYTDTSADYPECPFPGTYTWTYDGKNLAFQLFGEDKCEVRKADYDGQTYIKLRSVPVTDR